MPETFVEMARLKSNFLYDQVHIKSIAFKGNGVLIEYDYERHGERHDDLPAVLVSAKDWAIARDVAKADRKHFGETMVAQRLFAEGARHYNESQRSVPEDLAQDLEFADILKG